VAPLFALLAALGGLIAPSTPLVAPAALAGPGGVVVVRELSPSRERSKAPVTRLERRPLYRAFRVKMMPGSSG